MRTRIITGVVALAVFLPILIFASTPLFTLGGDPVTLFELAVAVISAVAVGEAAACAGFSKDLLLTVPSSALAAVLMLTFSGSLSSFAPALTLLIFYLLFAGVLLHKKYEAKSLLELFALVFYVTSSFGALLALFTRLDGFFFPFIFVGAWVTDTFAYFTGVFFGRHKLIPEVSPKKTIEGAVGGTLFCVLGFVTVGAIKGADAVALLVLALIGLAAALVSQLGDLSASLIKRAHGVKDYGKIFPGHGGILDRFDSILAVSVLLYLITELPVGGLFNV